MATNRIQSQPLPVRVTLALIRTPGCTWAITGEHDAYAEIQAVPLSRHTQRKGEVAPARTAGRGIRSRGRGPLPGHPVRARIPGPEPEPQCADPRSDFL